MIDRVQCMSVATLSGRRALCAVLLAFLATSQGCRVEYPPIVWKRIPFLPPLCTQLKDASLDEGEACLTIVAADEPENGAGLNVKAGEAYSVLVPEQQEWRDASIRHVAPCGKPGEGVMVLFSPWKKVRDSQWFSLIAEIKGGGESALYDICKGKEIKAAKSGRLAFYANDAWGMYWNNYGQIEVVVSRGNNNR